MIYKVYAQVELNIEADSKKQVEDFLADMNYLFEGTEDNPAVIADSNITNWEILGE